MIKSTLLYSLLMALSIGLQAQPVWSEIANGVWRTSIGQPQDLSLLSAAGITPQLAAIAKLSDPDFPLNQQHIRAEIIGGKTYLRFPLKKGEELYGLGLHFKTHNQRGRILNLHVDHYGGKDDGRTHAPVPFYVSSEGYGVLVDAAAYLTVYAGTAVRVDAEEPPVIKNRNTDKDWDAQPYSDAVEILVPAAGTDLYIFGGQSMLEVVQRYNLYCGGGYLPPKWGLGFTQRVPTLYSDQDILREVGEFAAHDFPLDFIGVEPGWHSQSYPCTFEWETSRFPDPAGFIQELADKGIRANLWLNPYVAPSASLYPKIKPYAGSHLVWNGIVPDLSMPEPRAMYKEHFQQTHLDIGVSGYKIDEVDGYDFWLWPDIATFPSGHTAEALRQTYGLLIQKMTADWFKEKNERTYGLVRGSNAGASALPYVIYNDYYSHKDFITALINSSFIGVLWTPEVRASKSAEEWLRRMQSVCFSPMAMLNAWADGTKPWSFPEVEDQVREVAQLRMQLLPYLYTAFARYQQEGIPPFRAMQLVEGFSFKVRKKAGELNGTDNPYAAYTAKEIQYQYMMGDAILVAPMFTDETSREVVLPKGKWYDFYSGDFVGDGEVLTITPGLDHIPLFVKDGGIIPMIKSRNQMPGPKEVLALEVRHYGTAESHFMLYDDDGISFNHEKGEYSWSELSANRDGNGWNGQLKIGNENAFHYDKSVNWRFMTKIK
ncbi:MAG: glycoside hydrolase family 31 protein [Saprospiraceae bacterium]